VTLVHSFNMVGIPRPSLVTQLGCSAKHNICCRKMAITCMEWI